MNREPTTNRQADLEQKMRKYDDISVKEDMNSGDMK